MVIDRRWRVGMEPTHKGIADGPVDWLARRFWTRWGAERFTRKFAVPYPAIEPSWRWVVWKDDR